MKHNRIPWLRDMEKTCPTCRKEFTSTQEYEDHIAYIHCEKFGGGWANG